MPIRCSDGCLTRYSDGVLLIDPDTSIFGYCSFVRCRFGRWSSVALKMVCSLRFGHAIFQHCDLAPTALVDGCRTRFGDGCLAIDRDSICESCDLISRLLSDCRLPIDADNLVTTVGFVCTPMAECRQLHYDIMKMDYCLTI